LIGGDIAHGYEYVAAAGDGAHVFRETGLVDESPLCLTEG